MTAAMLAGGSAKTADFHVASYNIHRCVGTDGRDDPDRIAAVLRELDAEAIGLQEVDSGYFGSRGVDQGEHLAQATGLTVVRGPTLIEHRGSYGNALLTRRPVLAVRRYELAIAGREPRGALDVDLDFDGEVVRVIVTHFGLRRRERHQQIRRLLPILSQHPCRLLVLIGDFNEWVPAGRPLRLLDECLGRSRPARTFPSRFPVLALDRIWVQPASALRAFGAHTSALARIASDHLPVRATIRLEDSWLRQRGEKDADR